MKNKLYIVVIIIFYTLCLFGCQRTPENIIVADKKQTDVQEYLSEEANANQDDSANSNFILEVPDHIEKNLESNDRLTQILVSANVTVPKLSDFHIVTVKPKMIENDVFNDLVVSLFKGNNLYMPTGENEFTKAEITDYILELKKEIADPASNLNSIKEMSPEEYQTGVAYYESEIKKFEDMLADAPDTIERDIVEPIIERGTPFIGISDLGKAQPATITANISESNKCRIDFYNFGEYIVDSRINPDISNPQNTDISYETAKQKAIDFVESLGDTGLSLSEKGLGMVYTMEELEKGTDSNCYVYIFTREFDGMNETYCNNLGFRSISTEEVTMDSYTEPFYPEYLLLRIDDTGILEMAWQSPVQIMDDVTSVELMSFEEIMNRFSQQMMVSGAWTDNTDIISRQLSISEIRLGFTRIEKIDSQNEYILVPTWDFFGSAKETYNDTVQDGALDESNSFIEETFGHSYLTINAIDGSIIDRALGY